MRARYFSGGGRCVYYQLDLTIAEPSYCPGVRPINISLPGEAAYSIDPASGAAVVSTAPTDEAGSDAQLPGSCAAIPEAYPEEVSWMGLGEELVGATWVPAAVVCTGTPRPPGPTVPPSLAPPRPMPSPPRADASWLELRLVDTSDVTSPGSPRTIFGVMQVRMPDGSWGLVCGTPSNAYLTRALAQYACRPTGLPYTGAGAWYGTFRSNTSNYGPVALTVALGCQLDLAASASKPQCTLLGGPTLTPQLFAGVNGSGVEGQLPTDMERYRALLEESVRSCPAKPAPGYYSAAFCNDLTPRPPYPPRPSPPPRPPPPPYMRRNDLRLRWTEVMPQTYSVEFGVQRGDPSSNATGDVGENGSTIVLDADGVEWGTQCVPGINATMPGPELSKATIATLCNQITGGQRPYGMILQGIRPFYPQITTVPPFRLRRNTTRVVVTDLECSPNGTAFSSSWDSDINARQPDINACRAATPLPTLPLSLDSSCSFTSMASKFLYCTEHKFNFRPWMTGIRLAQATQMQLAVPVPAGSAAAGGGVEGANGTAGTVLVNATVGRLQVRVVSQLELDWGRVCRTGFNTSVAQAACRELGLPTATAAVLSPSDLPRPPSPPGPPAPQAPLLLWSVRCALNDQRYVPASSNNTDALMLFTRDCRGGVPWEWPECAEEETDVVLACA
ncbi:hypothetical protein HYH03_006469 [Edaphochlamys debaryana]|uniref:SRCR domain-containing protein n=1 Tax=Edaphochlamys debaryana TaxID=47281 RepID=A0A835Y3Y6_9CHLO|nr:hypothetical protein HYH03_006469 [Edaphochlamys debaryana]|eukprot:KAG2495526.1 hypothetical protein HYH03_006469 [Edaphochlamys debaryana]